MTNDRASFLLTLGQRLVEARQRSGLKSSDLARHIGVSRAAVLYWERDVHKPGTEALLKLATFLSVSPEYLLNGPLLTMGERLVAARQRKGLRSTDLARRTGVSSAAVSYWERDIKKPTPETLLRLAKILDVSPDYLLNSPDAMAKVRQLIAKTRDDISLATGIRVDNLLIRIISENDTMSKQGTSDGPDEVIVQADSEVGERIAAVRKLRGLKAVDLARLVGVNRAAVSTWERQGVVPRIGVLERVSRALAVSPPYLLTGTEVKDPLATTRSTEILNKAREQVSQLLAVDAASLMLGIQYVSDGEEYPEIFVRSQTDASATS
jgi:transcriptional regulator with XRE-family HTH domain